MTIDLVRERSNLDHLSLWRSRFRVLSLKRIIKGDLRRGLEYACKEESNACMQARENTCMQAREDVCVQA